MNEPIIQQISSAENSLFKRLKKLADSARERRKSGETLLDGVHLLKAAADVSLEPECIILREGMQTDAEIQQCLVLFPKIKTIELPHRLFNQLSPVETPVGILALITIPRPEPTVHTAAVMLEHIQDPGNLGSIIRTGAAAGIERICLSKGCAEAWSPKALRSGMGAQFNIEIVEQVDLEYEVQNYKKVVVTSLDAPTSLYDIELTNAVAFVFGNEGAGVSEGLLSKATHKVKIPMPGNIESLNVSAAVAICLFERVRQTKSE